jgi:hypothetical protein
MLARPTRSAEVDGRRLVEARSAEAAVDALGERVLHRLAAADALALLRSADARG